MLYQNWIGNRIVVGVSTTSCTVTASCQCTTTTCWCTSGNQILISVSIPQEPMFGLKIERQPRLDPWEPYPTDVKSFAPFAIPRPVLYPFRRVRERGHAFGHSPRARSRH